MRPKRKLQKGGGKKFETLLRRLFYEMLFKKEQSQPTTGGRKGPLKRGLRKKSSVLREI